MKLMSRVADGSCRFGRVAALALWAGGLVVCGLQGQETAGSGPIAIVPLESKPPGAGPKVTGALEVGAGKAVIASSGTVESSTRTTEVLLPHRGVLRVCAATAVRLTVDASEPAGETLGLMVSMEHGAVEASFATGRNADILLTPDFRILIGGPGAVDLKVRLGQGGDTCVDNAGINAPYVLVSSVFEGGAYRVQAGQRVMFEHGSLREVVDQEKEPCGCPPEALGATEFPLAQSEGLAPGSAATPTGMKISPSETTLSYTATVPAPTPAVAAPQTPVVVARKPGLLARMGRFFKRVFGAE
jgi:hypothetical protein